jgi:hypothetical protein
MARLWPLSDSVRRGARQTRISNRIRRYDSIETPDNGDDRWVRLKLFHSAGNGGQLALSLRAVWSRSSPQISDLRLKSGRAAVHSLKGAIRSEKLSIGERSKPHYSLLFPLLY